MSRLFYRWLLGVLVVLWASGVVWMVLHYFYPTHSEFGTAPNAGEPWLLRIHGVVAVAAVFLLGGVAVSHVVMGWRQSGNRRSGLTLGIIGIALIVTGYALYYLTADSVRESVAIAHEALGVAAIASALIHWRRG